MKKICPFCNGRNIIKIEYGFPNQELIKDYEEGKVRLGGCCISDDSRKYYCKDCKEEFGRISYDNIDIIDDIKIEYGSFHGGYKTINLSKWNDKFRINNCSGFGFDFPYLIEVDYDEEINKLLNYYCLLDYKENYGLENCRILDGYSVDIEISSNNKIIKEIYCYCNVPVLLENMIKHINRLFLKIDNLLVTDSNSLNQTSRKEEISNYILEALNHSSMYYKSNEKYWPSIKLFSKSGVLFYTSKDRKFNIVTFKIPSWDFKSDMKIILELLNSNNLVGCESEKNKNEYCYTISLKN